jgi:hypothetical protein
MSGVRPDSGRVSEIRPISGQPRHDLATLRRHRVCSGAPHDRVALRYPTQLAW